MAKEVAQLTDKQTLFLEHLASKDCGGDIRKAMTAAGYSSNTKIAEIVKALKAQIIEVSDNILATGTVKAALGLMDSIDNPHKPGIGNKIAAAKEVLDRAGLGKKSEGVGTNIQTQNIFILPSKEKKVVDVVPNTPLEIIDQ